MKQFTFTYHIIRTNIPAGAPAAERFARKPVTSEVEAENESVARVVLNQLIEQNYPAADGYKAINIEIVEKHW